MHCSASIEGNRQDGPSVIICVLTQEVDPTWRGCTQLRGRAENLAEERLPGVSWSLFRHSVLPVGGIPLRLGWCALLTTVILPASAGAQLAPVGIPRGLLRVEVDGSFAYANERFNDGTRENLGANFTSPALGSDRIPTLAEADQRIAVLLGQPNYKLNLGASIGTAQVSTGTGAFSLGIGITKGLSIFGRLPIVSSWWRQTVAIDTTTSNAGVNAADPAFGDATGAATAEAFFTQFNVSLAELQERITSGTYDGNPTEKALALQTLASGMALSDSLSALIVEPGTASPFLPIATSSAGAALGGQVTTMQQALLGLGVSSFSEPLPLPANPAEASDLAGYATSATGAIGYSTLSNSKRTGIGDVEAGAVYTFIDHWNADAARGSRLAASVTVRFPTGEIALPTDPFGVSLGAGTPAVGMGVALDLGGGTFGARLTGSYLLQLEGEFTRRVGSPLSAILPRNTTADVTVNPGDQIRIGIAPYYRMARALGLVGSAAWVSQGDDDVQYATAGDSIPGVPASIMADGTGASRLLLSIGLTYSSSGQRADGTNGMPLDAGWRWETTVASSGGIATKWSAIVFFARVYARLW